MDPNYVRVRAGIAGAIAILLYAFTNHLEFAGITLGIGTGIMLERGLLAG